MGVYHIYHKRRTEVQAKGWATSKRGKEVKTVIKNGFVEGDGI